MEEHHHDPLLTRVAALTLPPAVEGVTRGELQLCIHGLTLERGQLEPGAFVDGPCVASQTTACSAEYSLQVRDGTVLVRML